MGLGGDDGLISGGRGLRRDDERKARIWCGTLSWLATRPGGLGAVSSEAMTGFG